jgi:hypothetical protein
MNIGWTILIAIIAFLVGFIPNWFGGKISTTDKLAIIGAVTGVVALIVTVVKELIRDRPNIKIYEAYPQVDNSGNITIHKSNKGDRLVGRINLYLYTYISNSGLRPTHIVLASSQIGGVRPE